MICEACLFAESNPLTGRLTPFCRGCEIRKALNAPLWQREEFLNSLVDDGKREQVSAAIAEECRRRKAFEGRVVA